MSDDEDYKLSPEETPDESVIDASVAREVVFDEAARDEIDTHVHANTKIEQGGVLIGEVDETTGRVTVVAAVPATRAVGAVASLTFTHEAWDEVNDVIAAQYAGYRMVGWYHSHPGFGIFLSEYDTFIQQNFFAATWQLAYVVDPLLGKSGFFGWEDGKIARLASWTVLARGSARAVKEPERGEPKAPAPVEKSGIGFATTFAAVLIALIGGIFGGYFIHTNPANPKPPAPPTVTLGSTKAMPAGSNLTVATTWTLTNGKLAVVATVNNVGKKTAFGYITGCAPAALGLPRGAVTTPKALVAQKPGTRAVNLTPQPTPSDPNFPAGSCVIGPTPLAPSAAVTDKFAVQLGDGQAAPGYILDAASLTPKFVPVTTH